MEKNLLAKIFISMLFITMLSSAGFSQNSDNNQNKKVVGDQPGHSKELVLGVPKATDKNLSMLITAINQVDGLQYVSFCSKHKLVLLNYDKSIFKAPKDIVEAIQNQNFTMPLFIKQSTFEAVKEMCQLH